MANIELVTKENKNYSATVVFIHGLGGNMRSTWKITGRDDTFWPTWLGDDFQNLRVVLLGYESAITNWKTPAMALPDRVSNILSRLPASDFLLDSPIIFICHSLEGLIAKSLILTLNNRQSSDERFSKILTNIKLVIFFGTPHYGSRLASLANVFPLSIILRPSSLSKGLVENDPSLRGLNDNYKMFSRSRIQHLVVSENKPTKYLGFIVAHNSADPGLMDATSIPVDGTHSSICKPENRDSEVYQVVKQKISDFFFDENVFPKIDRNLRSETQFRDLNKRQTRSEEFNDRLSRHTLILEDFQGQPFTVLICGPTVANCLTSGSYRLFGEIDSKLKIAGFDVIYGLDEALHSDAMNGDLDTSSNEINFVRSRCDAVIFIADSIGAFSQIGAIGQKVSTDKTRSFSTVDFTTIIDLRFSMENEFFRRGTFAIFSSLGFAEFVDLKSFNPDNIIERLKAKRMLGSSKKLTRKKGK